VEYQTYNREVEQPIFMGMLVVEDGFFYVMKEKGLFTDRKRVATCKCKIKKMLI